MTEVKPAPDIASGRLPAEAYIDNFCDLHPPLDPHQAMAESDRCYFCYDAPCVTACPTSIDIPLFIRQISTNNPTGAARTIFAQNILGGMCARVCPTETLCEQACVRNEAEEKPVKIGELQRFATDHYMQIGGEGVHERAPATGKKVAIVGGGPASLSCAHALARNGHDVTIFEAREKIGGLNEYGIASYKSVDNFAQREVEFVLSVDGIEVKTETALGRDFELADLRKNYDAIFLGMGLVGVNALNVPGEELEGAIDAVEYIARLRQEEDLSSLPVGRRVVVIGGGMTAVDIAVQIKRLGADEVTIAYRRGQNAMKASLFEQELALTNGVSIREWVRPLAIRGEKGHVNAIELERTRIGADGRLEGTGEKVTLAADQVFKAIGQTFVPSALNGSAESLQLENGRLKVDAMRKTSLLGVWAGGDCIHGGDDLTVAAVEDGKVAAQSIHAALKA